MPVPQGALAPRAAPPSVIPVTARVVDDETPSTLSLASVANALRLWWPWALPASLLLATLGAAFVAYMSEPQYEAIAWLRVDSRAPYLAFPSDSRKELGSPMQTQIELIRSPLVTERVVERPEVRDLSDLLDHGSDPGGWLGRQLVITPVGESEFFQLSYSSKDPSQAAALCNAVLDVYLEVQAEFSDERTRRIIELLEIEKDKWREEQERLRESVRELSEKTGNQLVWSDENQQFQTVRGGLKSLTERLGAAQVEQEMLEAKITAQREAINRSTPRVSETEIEAALDLEPQVQKLRDLIAEKHAKRMQVESVSARKGDDPQVVVLQREIDSLEQQLAGIKAQARPRAAQRHLERVRGQQLEQLAEWEAQRESFAALARTLEEQIGKQKPEDAPSGGSALDLEFARFDLARTEGVFDAITRRIDNLRTELRAPTQVGMVRRAGIPKNPKQAAPLLKMSLAGVGGFLLPFGLALAWERLRRRISDPAQLEGDARLPLLGTVARLSENPVSASVRRSRRLEQRWDQYRESVEYVRVNLAVSDTLRQVQSIVVSSAVSHEGKTRLATALAVSLAGADRDKTLLVDGDLRSPDIHRQFDMPNSSGLADVLAGRADWRQTIVQPRGQQLHIMPAGRALQSPNTLLCGSRLGELLAELRRHYRFIIVDAPPVLLVSDGLVLAHAADGTLLVTMHNHSRETELRSAVERLQMAGARLLGTVLNAVPPRRYGYGAYGYGIPNVDRHSERETAPPSQHAAPRPMAPEASAD